MLFELVDLEDFGFAVDLLFVFDFVDLVDLVPLDLDVVELDFLSDFDREVTGWDAANFLSFLTVSVFFRVYVLLGEGVEVVVVLVRELRFLDLSDDLLFDVFRFFLAGAAEDSLDSSEDDEESESESESLSEFLFLFLFDD